MSDSEERPARPSTIPILTSAFWSVLVIVYWRGASNLLDRYFMPENPLWSNVLCFVCPVILAAVAALLSGDRFVWR